jgi:hypothetical protein
MPIESTHPLYDENIENWTACRDAYAGDSAVKAKGQTYLPRIDPNQSGEAYAAYKRRALYYEAVGRTVDGFVGAISRKPHIIELPAALNAFKNDAAGNGIGLGEFVKALAGESLLTGRGGVLVDYDDTKQRPFLSLYSAESITNWSANSVVLLETVYEADAADPYKQVEIKQYRELAMHEGVYTVTLWRQAPASSAGASWLVYDVIEPKRRGVALDRLPWFWLSPVGASASIAKPPLLGLVNTALSHYRTSADLEHGRHFTALPTLWVAGITGDEPIQVGGGAVIKLADPAARVGYAEFTGQGLGSLENALATKEHMMAVLGAAVFGGGRKGVEAAETARIRTAGENSLLMGIVSSVEETLTAALKFAAEWSGAMGDIVVKLNRDFIDQRLDGQTLTGMVQAFQCGALSLETFLFNLQQAEMLEPNTQIDEEAAKLRAARAPT